MKNHANVTNVTNSGNRGRRKPERGSKAADLLGQSSPQENQGLIAIFSIFKVPSSFSSKSKQGSNRLPHSHIHITQSSFLKLDNPAHRCLFSTKPRPLSISRPMTSCKPPSGKSSHCYFISIIMNYWIKSTAFTNVLPFPVKITRRDSNPT